MAAGSGTHASYGQLLAEVRDDWYAAQHSKAQAEQRALANYRLYRRFRDDVDKHGFMGAVENHTGPFGWSKLTVPVIFWIVETIVPRVAVTPPTWLVKPMTAEAVPYAQAKEAELQDTIDRMRVREGMHVALKRMVLYGDGPTKWTWDRAAGRPRFTAINWFDWFLSPDATTPDDAEVVWHRTWFTRRQLQRLSRLVDRNGRPLFHGLEHVTGSEQIEAGDPTFADRKEISGQGQMSWAAEGGLYCLVEGWYQDGTVVVLGGAHGDRIVQFRTSPFRDENGNPTRPFVVFSNTPDTESPYSIGDAEMLQDHQSELSTLRNQAIDQTTVNINAPVVYSGNVTAPEIDAAFGQPGGKLKVTGDVTRSVMRLAPGSVSADFFNWYGNIREESQFISGVNDNQAGQAAAREQTATEIKLINNEANKRWQYKIAITEERFAQAGRLVDLMLRRYAPPGRAVRLLKPTTVPEGQRGLMGLGWEELQPGSVQAAFARMNPLVNAEGTAYDVSVKAGSLAAPSETEEFEKLMTAVQALSANDAIAANVNWREVAKEVAAVCGVPAEKWLLSDQEIANQQMIASLEAAVAAGGGQEPTTAPVAA